MTDKRKRLLEKIQKLLEKASAGLDSEDPAILNEAKVASEMAAKIMEEHCVEEAELPGNKEENNISWSRVTIETPKNFEWEWQILHELCEIYHCKGVAFGTVSSRPTEWGVAGTESMKEIVLWFFDRIVISALRREEEFRKEAKVRSKKRNQSFLMGYASAVCKKLKELKNTLLQREAMTAALVVVDTALQKFLDTQNMQQKEYNLEKDPLDMNAYINGCDQGDKVSLHMPLKK